MAHIGKAHSAYTKIGPSTHKSENLKWMNNAVNQSGLHEIQDGCLDFGSLKNFTFI